MATTQDELAEKSNASPLAVPSRQPETEDYAQITASVTLTLQPMIKETVEAAMKSGH